MGWIKKKQVLGLDHDLGSLHFSSILLKRTTSFSGNPDEGEAVLDNQTATNITTIKVNVKDSLIGNSYSQLKDITELNDLIIRNQETGDIAIYSIQSITSEVNSSSEGYFILTVQHSFGYSNTFTSGELVYYFRGVTSASIVDVLEDQDAKIEANDVASLGRNLAFQQSVNLSLPKKHVESVVFNNNPVKIVFHNFDNPDIIVQVLDSNGALYNAGIDNYTNNTVRITVNDLDTYKVIIMG
jgi:hypothetical protein